MGVMLQYQRSPGRAAHSPLFWPPQSALARSSNRFAPSSYFGGKAMYGFLKRHLPGPLADILMAMWYALLILAVLYCVFEPQADFRYLVL